MRTFAVISFLITLTACGGGGTSAPPQQPVATITCADVINPGLTASRCTTPRSAGLQLFKEAYARDFDAGDLSRAQLIEASENVENTAPAAFNGWIEAAFDAGCGGAPTWDIMPKRRFIVQAEEIVTIAAAGQCGDMPLGRRALTVTAYAADATTVVAQAVVRFRLVE